MTKIKAIAAFISLNFIYIFFYSSNHFSVRGFKKTVLYITQGTADRSNDIPFLVYMKFSAHKRGLGTFSKHREIFIDATSKSVKKTSCLWLKTLIICSLFMFLFNIKQGNIIG